MEISKNGIKEIALDGFNDGYNCFIEGMKRYFPNHSKEVAKLLDYVASLKGEFLKEADTYWNEALKKL